jgi:hypothetical protein
MFTTEHRTDDAVKQEERADRAEDRRRKQQVRVVRGGLHLPCRCRREDSRASLISASPRLRPDPPPRAPAGHDVAVRQVVVHFFGASSRALVLS